MSYYSRGELDLLGFRHLGRNVLISRLASIYFPESISIGDNSRIDDFCTISGNVHIGRNVHIAVHSNLAGGVCGISIDDFAGLAYGCHIVAQTDDYSGESMTNPTVPSEFKLESCAPVHIGQHVILGVSTIVLPGVELPDGVAAGAQTLFIESVEPWGIYVGSPARRLKERSRALLARCEEYLSHKD